MNKSFAGLHFLVILSLSDDVWISILLCRRIYIQTACYEIERIVLRRKELHKGDHLSYPDGSVYEVQTLYTVITQFLPMISFHKFLLKEIHKDIFSQICKSIFTDVSLNI